METYISDDDHFQFKMSDIKEIRKTMKRLVDGLEVSYEPIAQLEKEKKEEKKKKKTKQ